MTSLFFFLATLFGSLTTAHTSGHTLTVTLHDLASTDGSVKICLMNTAEQHLRDCYEGTIYRFGADKPLRVVFDNLPAGDYAIMAFHDEDDDGKLDTNGLFGLPSEDYAFSNNPSTLFGPPSYEKCRFALRGDMEMALEF